MLLEGRPEGASGTCVACVMEGTRPVLAEVQALVSQAAYGTPQRNTTGFDSRRMNMLLAILEKRIGLNIIGFWKEIIKMSIAPILISILSYQLLDYVIIDSYFDLIVAIVLFTVLYLPIFWFASMNRYEKDLFGGMLTKILRIKKNARNR